MIVGNPSNFAIESMITQPYSRLSQRGLGFFLIHLRGASFGVRSPEATLLACSLDSVRRRIAQQGKHIAPFVHESSLKIVSAFRATSYDLSGQEETYFGMNSDSFRNIIVSNEIVWAPDGDEAFDDGSYVLQFDLGDRVRLVAFRNADRQEDVEPTVVDKWIQSEEFYETLNKWQRDFLSEWQTAIEVQK